MTNAETQGSTSPRNDVASASTNRRWQCKTLHANEDLQMRFRKTGPRFSCGSEISCRFNRFRHNPQPKHKIAVLILTRKCANLNSNFVRTTSNLNQFPIALITTISEVNQPRKIKTRRIRAGSLVVRQRNRPVQDVSASWTVGRRTIQMAGNFLVPTVVWGRDEHAPSVPGQEQVGETWRRKRFLRTRYLQVSCSSNKYQKRFCAGSLNT